MIPSGEERDFRYVVGVDLGTTNSAVAYVDLDEPRKRSGPRSIRLFRVPQLVATGEMSPRTMLPSFLYLPGAYDLPAGSASLPWDAERDYIVGELAREQGARVPGRLVSSAKSWLSHAGVDRTAPILPWGAGEDVPKVSPIEASARYLQHVREAWNAQKAEGDENFLERQHVVLTIPASFDEVARELTVAAAREAGLPNVVLLEEPLAAFYSWVSANESGWQAHMRAGQLILVCDVGGGTSDFSIMDIRTGEAGLRFNRLAVGEHLMLGGDNMDMTLGRRLEARLVGEPGKLDSDRWHQLVHQARKAKETLLGDEHSDAPVDVTIMGTGGGLISGTLKTSLDPDEARRLLLEGFFPESELTEEVAGERRRGLTELGLPYVQDPAVSRHLAGFWRRFESLLRDETGREAVYPDFVLYNGGALVPSVLRDRLTQILRSWFVPVAGSDYEPVELENPNPELAVALGAAYYGLVRAGEGVRVGSGSPRAYYVTVEGLEETPGESIRAVCLVPRGVEEGFEAELETPQFTALTNQPVAFEVSSSSTRLGDDLGDLVDVSPDEITSLPPIRTVLRYGKGTVSSLPVQLAVRLTSIGTLDLWCHARETEHRWRLQFDVRQSPEPSAPSRETVDQRLIESARDEIRKTFGKAEAGVETASPAEIRSKLEEVLETRKERWPTPLIRQLSDTLLETQEARSRTPVHEERWLNLLGFCLRPGFGDPLDEWRLKQAWKLHHHGLHFPRQTQCRTEWWIFWRRVAGGLKPGQQLQIYQEVRSYLDPAASRKKTSPMFPKRLASGEELEVWLAVANLEWLPPEVKAELGQQLLPRLRKAPKPRELWALTRFGSRKPMYGPIDRLVPSEKAAEWVETLLSWDLEPTSPAAYCLVLLSCETGDRIRDVPQEIRARVESWLEALPDPEHFHRILREPERALDQEEEDWMFGESLPSGLVLAPSPGP